MSQNGVNVSAISASIGDGLAYGPDTCPNDIDFALSAARDAEIVNIYASGNEGATNGVTYPACSPYSLSVGAVDKNGAIAGFTDRGPGLDVLAPGMNVNSTLPGGNGARSGTSMAAPFVSGTVAMMRQYTQSNGLTGLPSTIENAITKSGANNTGWPLLDTHAAILLLQPQSNQTQNTTSNQTTPNQTYQILAAPTLTYVNITPFTPNSTTAVAGVWNYTDGDGDLQNGSTYTWFVNNTEAWRDSSLVGYWKLDGDGLDALNINNGNLTNSPLTTPGLIKSALNFSGVSSYIDLHTSAFGFTKDHSLLRISLGKDKRLFFP